ncbi:MAG: hypothetical protein H0T76_21935 [Nannocystis sp.]|nr:hypothetical protein [Nannocystis sp.]MBA3549141.1 hypothetical protein [Nannocystis sp.]
MDTALMVGSSLLGLLLFLLVLLLVLLLVVRRAVRRLRARGRAEIARRYPASEVLLEETLAQSFGQQSKGATQLRGSGALALTGTELCFVMYVPASELRIPLASIDAVSLVRSHLGKSQGTKLLHVRFTREGVEDAIAWRLPEPDAWQARIDARRG